MEELIKKIECDYWLYSKDGEFIRYSSENNSTEEFENDHKYEIGYNRALTKVINYIREME